jgi:ubiquitin C-terminal hydrolase
VHQFQGFGQHDSHECISSILDLLGEDLYRHGRKPFVAMAENEGRSIDDYAEDSWNKHLHRNESIITDLFHGQYKSTVQCSQCNRVSVTFDPLSSLLLPIPDKKTEVKMFYIPYKMQVDKDYTNYNCGMSLRGTDTVQTLRNQIEKRYGQNPSTYITSHVFNNKFEQHHNTRATITDIDGRQGLTLLYEIDPDLHH